MYRRVPVRYPSYSLGVFSNLPERDGTPDTRITPTPPCLAGAGSGAGSESISIVSGHTQANSPPKAKARTAKRLAGYLHLNA